MDINKIKSVLGYEIKDHVVSGFIVGLIAIGLVFFLQVKYYGLDAMPEFINDFKEPFLKRSLLGALAVFLLFNYMDKLYSSKGVVLSVVICGIYLIKIMFF